MAFECEMEQIAAVIGDLRATAKRLTAENARLVREREILLFRDVYRNDDGWHVRGVWFSAQPFLTREEAISRLIDHARRSWDWPAESRRRKEEGWPDGPC